MEQQGRVIFRVDSGGLMALCLDWSCSGAVFAFPLEGVAAAVWSVCFMHASDGPTYCQGCWNVIAHIHPQPCRAVVGWQCAKFSVVVLLLGTG